MGWFDEQIRHRIEQDNLDFSDAFSAMAGVIEGHRAFASGASRDGKTRAAIEDILSYFHVRMPKELDEGADLNTQLEDILRPTGIMYRTVDLSGDWYRDCIGPLLAETVDGGVVALLPRGVGGYAYHDYQTGKTVPITRKTNEQLSGLATCFYRPLPLKALGVPDLMRYILASLTVWDFVMIGLAALAVTLIGMLLPHVNSILFDAVVPSGQMRLLMPIACLLVGITISTLLIDLTKSIVTSRLSSKTDIAVEAAAMMRVLSLPAGFFRRFGAGELHRRVCSIRSLCSMLSDAVLGTGITSLFSLIYIGQMLRYAGALTVPAMIVVVATVVLSIASSLLQMRISTLRMEGSAKQSGLEFALISGVQKIKLAGAEKRAFSKWASLYSENAALQYDPPALIKLSSVFTTAVSLIGTIAIYYFAVQSKVSAADYIAFNVSYGFVSGAFSELAAIVLTAADIRPVLDLVKPILEAVPEVTQGSKMVTRLGGGVEFDDVSFRYTESGPMVLDDISLKIRPGQYIAIVGRTGCGKSTLIRLLLGFERPLSGAVYYDGVDLTKLNLESLRRHIGVVLQDGKLFPGSIYSNITISAPWLSVDEAWAAAATSGIDEDIKAMPMGMHTLIGMGSGGISGGQAQRLMIARAIAPKPRILIFDEATSALDNITQKQVSDALAKLKCTRIVVAHRLSTIKQCSRIVVLDGGHIVQDGTYDELLNEKDGLFAELIRRQRLNMEDEPKQE